MHRLQPFEQKQLSREIALMLRKDNVRNIRRQVSANGQKWEKRKKTREVAKPIRYVYRSRDGHVRELEMSSYRNEGDRIIGFDKEAGGIRTMLKSGMLRSLSPVHRTNSSAQNKKAQLMLTGMAQTRHMSAKGYPDAAVVEIGGRAARIARVHHYGLRDQVSAGGPVYQYPERPLLGISNQLADQVVDHILRRLAA